MPMFSQQSVSDFLKRKSYLREEMTLPTLGYHANYQPESVSEAGFASIAKAADFRIDGRVEDRHAPAPLEAATIGSNGRDTVTGQVHFIGIDIDGANHSKGHDAESLDSLIKKLMKVRWLRVMRSRSGKGYHLYGYLGREIFAEDDSAMYPLAAALVQRVAEEIEDDDFSSWVDCAGSYMFYASPNPGEGGYEVVQEAKDLFSEMLEPMYDPGVADYSVEDLKDFEPEHIRFIDWMRENAKKDCHQVGRLLILHAHTSDIAAAHAALKLRGKFETVASGTGDAKRNCAMIAVPGGSWIVVQWGSNNETSWQVSKRGARYTLFNSAPTLAEFVETHCVIQNQRSKAYCFSTEQAAELCGLYGVELPATDAGYFAVTQAKAGIVIEIDVKQNDQLSKGWQRVSKQKACFVIATHVAGAADPSTRIRVAYAKDGKNFQPYRRVRSHWQATTHDDARTRLRLMGLDSVQCDRVLTTDTPYEIVSEPFKGEFPRSHQWNRGATQLAFPVAKERGPYPHWQMMLDHCGVGFNDAVANDVWCQSHGIRDGADYLRMWFARLFRFPKERLPGVGLYSPSQNCGKSTLWTAHGNLMTRRGYFNSPSPLLTDFNGPLLGCVLWDFDDVDLSQRNSEMYRKLQPLMTNSELAIESKGVDPFTVANCTHISHTANQLQYFTIQPGDTRWIIAEVPELDNEIPAGKFIRALLKEAPYYLRALFDLPMPEEGVGRMFLPLLDTSLKFRLMASRSERGLTQEQAKWLARLKVLAAEGRLDRLTTFETLYPMMEASEGLTVVAFANAWPKFEPVLTDAGFECSNRQNNGGKCPAAWSIKVKGKTDEQAMEPRQLSRVA